MRGFLHIFREQINRPPAIEHRLIDIINTIFSGKPFVEKARDRRLTELGGDDAGREILSSAESHPVVY